ncbi:hypothetical protein L5515_002163 [Caenorhabditis briggsae]|uniref:NTF2-like domain-containing protein n=1 Tax=Caenorhabditis briggsae TaxID=6238 RepID=A0AAE9J4I8_CAEBR|nr:hypothetical protein L5515_002163 [Caenorhabditis briggsae]
MSPSILVLCLLAGTSWAFVSDDPDLRGTDSFGGHPNDIFYFTRNVFAPSSDTAKQVVEKFLVRMTRSFESGEVDVISGLFQPGFVFKGCKGTYGKKAVVNWLSTLPPGVKFTYTITDTIKLTHIGYYVDIAGIKEYAIKTAFVLDKFDQKLKVGYMMGCPKKQRSFLGFYQPEDSNDVVQRFLSSMKETIDSHEPALIGKLFDDAFIFKGCHGTYTKAQAIAKLTSLPSGASFDFSLVTSKWNSQGQIEYTVSVSVPRMDSFKAQFVYCPHKNVLKSGSIEHCAARRFSVFY